jgi:hypothetical protein
VVTIMSLTCSSIQSRGSCSALGFQPGWI